METKGVLSIKYTCSQERAFESLFSLAPRSFSGEAQVPVRKLNGKPGMDLEASDYKRL